MTMSLIASATFHLLLPHLGFLVCIAEAVCVPIDQLVPLSGWVSACGALFVIVTVLLHFLPTQPVLTNRDRLPYLQGAELKKVIEGAVARGFTDIIVINEDKKKPTALVVCHLPHGPTAHFKLSSIRYPKEIINHGRKTSHHPEILLNNFHTRLGQQVGRMINALFPQSPEFVGRSVVTFHNQRDFIFFRYHRYIFKNAKKVGLQELGPRFTLKLRWLQQGTFDTKFGEYEWIHKRGEMDDSRRRFFL
jgi:ribosome production factor 1